MTRAPKKCGRFDCDVRVTGRAYCPAHTPQYSTRRSRLPADWPKLRAQVKKRAGGRCEAGTHEPNCDGTGVQCDHVVAGDNHSLTNLQWLSKQCHQAKSNRENRARNRAR